MLARLVKYYYKDVLQTKSAVCCAELKRETEERAPETGFA